MVSDDTIELMLNQPYILREGYADIVYHTLTHSKQSYPSHRRMNYIRSCTSMNILVFRMADGFSSTNRLLQAAGILILGEG